MHPSKNDKVQQRKHSARARIDNGAIVSYSSARTDQAAYTSCAAGKSQCPGGRNSILLVLLIVLGPFLLCAKSGHRLWLISITSSAKIGSVSPKVDLSGRDGWESSRPSKWAEWLKQISKMTFLEGESFALSGDVVEDVCRKFRTKRGQHRRS